jgi:hypothetical protein
MGSAQLQNQLSDLWTAQDVCAYYGVTAMTVHLWRGRGLPAVVIPGHMRPAVRFLPSEVRAWAMHNGINKARERSVERFRPAMAG